MLKKEYDALKKIAKEAVSVTPIEPHVSNPIMEIFGILTFIALLVVLIF
jgi:hypothetical protein